MGGAVSPTSLRQLHCHQSQLPERMRRLFIDWTTPRAARDTRASLIPRKTSVLGSGAWS